jgi:hypothetical protein
MPNVSAYIGKRAECPKSREWAWREEKDFVSNVKGRYYI